MFHWTVDVWGREGGWATQWWAWKRSQNFGDSKILIPTVKTCHPKRHCIFQAPIFGNKSLLLLSWIWSYFTFFSDLKHPSFWGKGSSPPPLEGCMFYQSDRFSWQALRFQRVPDCCICEWNQDKNSVGLPSGADFRRLDFLQQKHNDGKSCLT